jgi:FdhD protein
MLGKKPNFAFYPANATASWPIKVWSDGSAIEQEDVLAAEEPLEMRIAFLHGQEQVERPLSVTMRTPGHDRELVCGFLLTEGLVRTEADIVDISSPARNVLRVELSGKVKLHWQQIERHFYTSSSCGVCGKTSIQAVQLVVPHELDPARTIVSDDLILSLPQRLGAAQRVFQLTGGLHGCALFSTTGELLLAREDVGRHNALDKLIGERFLAQRLPLADTVLLVSGRASFELVQKALMAGVAVLAAVGAPSSLAAQLASKAGMTLLGFVRDGRFNVYCGGHRIGPNKASATTPPALTP